MKGQLEKLKSLLIALGVLFVGFIFAYFKFFNVLQPPQDYGESQTSISPTQEALKLTIDFGSGNYLNYETPYAQNTTPYSLLRQVASQNNFQVQSQTYSYGPFITSIDGIAGDNQFFWGYYVNGQMGNVASDQYQLSPGDKVEWKYEAVQ